MPRRAQSELTPLRRLCVPISSAGRPSWPGAPRFSPCANRSGTTAWLKNRASPYGYSEIIHALGTLNFFPTRNSTWPTIWCRILSPWQHPFARKDMPGSVPFSPSRPLNFQDSLSWACDPHADPGYVSEHRGPVEAIREETLRWSHWVGALGGSVTSLLTPIPARSLAFGWRISGTSMASPFCVNGLLGIDLNNDAGGRGWVAVLAVPPEGTVAESSLLVEVLDIVSSRRLPNTTVQAVASALRTGLKLCRTFTEAEQQEGSNVRELLATKYAFHTVCPALAALLTFAWTTSLIILG